MIKKGREINIYKKILLNLLILSIGMPIQAISLVYNLKIRRAFKLGFMQDRSKKLTWVMTSLPIIYKSNRTIFKEKTDATPLVDIHERRSNKGLIFNLRAVSTDKWWFEFTTGLEKEKLKSRGTNNFDGSRSGLDDFVFSGGYNIFPNEELQFTAYLLTGFPTYRKVTPIEAQGVLLGTRCFSLGAGTEFSYGVIDTPRNNLTLIFQNRFLHFFNRKWSPILPCGAKIAPGNVTDLLFSIQFRQNKNMFEIGYDATFFTNEALLLKSGTVDAPNLIRKSFYLTFAHICKDLPMVKKPGAIGFGFSIGRMSKVLPTTVSGFWGNLTAFF